MAVYISDLIVHNCGHCGGEHIKFVEVEGENGYIVCKDCGMQTRTGMIEEVVNIWNAKAGTPAAKPWILKLAINQQIKSVASRISHCIDRPQDEQAKEKLDKEIELYVFLRKELCKI